MAVSERGASDIENSLYDSVVYWTKQKVPAITCRIPNDGARLGEAHDDIKTAFDSLVALPITIRISMGKGTLWVFKGGDLLPHLPPRNHTKFGKRDKSRKADTVNDQYQICSLFRIGHMLELLRGALTQPALPST
jgi:hypothetical protein